MSVQHLNIQKLRPAEMHSSPTIRIIGRRGAGKTYLAAHLAEQLCSPARSYAFGPSIAPMGSYAAIPAEQRFEDISSEWIYALDTTQRQVGSTPALVILDDSELLTKSEAINGVLYARNRIRQITTISIAQTSFGTPITQRANTDYVVCMRRTNNSSALRSLFNEYGGTLFASYEQFTQVLDQCTRGPYECLVLDLRGNAIFWYRAPGPTE